MRHLQWVGERELQQQADVGVLWLLMVMMIVLLLVGDSKPTL